MAIVKPLTDRELQDIEERWAPFSAGQPWHFTGPTVWRDDPPDALGFILPEVLARDVNLPGLADTWAGSVRDVADLCATLRVYRLALQRAIEILIGEGLCPREAFGWRASRCRQGLYCPPTQPDVELPERACWTEYFDSYSGDKEADHVKP